MKLIQGNIERAPVYNQMVDSAKKNRYFGPIIMLTFGLIFLGFATYQLMTVGFEPSDSISWGMGTAFLIFGLINLYRVISFSQQTR